MGTLKAGAANALGGSFLRIGSGGTSKQASRTLSKVNLGSEGRASIFLWQASLALDMATESIVSSLASAPWIFLDTATRTLFTKAENVSPSSCFTSAYLAEGTPAVGI